MRTAILTTALAFTTLLAAATARDFIRHGLTVPATLGALVAALFLVALLGALMHPPEQ